MVMVLSATSDHLRSCPRPQTPRRCAPCWPLCASCSASSSPSTPLGWRRWVEIHTHACTAIRERSVTLVTGKGGEC